ncbi:MAG: organic hydroperoxide reductase OsmC/OhrA [Gammaproteobacteria bacterium]|jgi:organic hydroperoxide reductase OsmC/OhrA
MQPLPHTYRARAETVGEGGVSIFTDGVPVLSSNAPEQFGGPGDAWSPEAMLVGAVVSCFCLTFRAIARGSHLEWRALRCDGAATLSSTEHAAEFTAMALDVQLTLAPLCDIEKALRLLDKAKTNCMVSRSLKFEPTIRASAVHEA